MNNNCPCSSIFPFKICHLLKFVLHVDLETSIYGNIADKHIYVLPFVLGVLLIFVNDGLVNQLKYGRVSREKHKNSCIRKSMP